MVRDEMPIADVASVDVMVEGDSAVGEMMISRHVPRVDVNEGLEEINGPTPESGHRRDR